MAYKWKPNAAQRAAYKVKMQERESLPIRGASGAIRTGCRIKYYSVNRGNVISGEVVKHSYGSERNQHTFTVLSECGEKIMVKGRNLYPNIIEHSQGAESLKTATNGN